MKKNKFRYKKLYCSLYRADVHLTFGDNNGLKKWYKKNKIETSVDYQNLFGFVEEFDGEYHIHFFAYGFTTVVHECFHLAHKILSSRGLKLEDSSQEAYAYYLDYLSGLMRDYLEKWTKK